MRWGILLVLVKRRLLLLVADIRRSALEAA
jgi:hypothetical protein